MEAKLKVIKTYEYGMQIVILQRGWIVIGLLTRKGNECRVENASVIRFWGTTKGLGEIAKNGPTEKTVLDPCPTVRFHYLTMVAQMDCSECKWQK